jgi:hypothetical protein
LRQTDEFAAARENTGKIAKARSIGGKTARQALVISARHRQIP